jgi:hypothetical protein
MRLQVKVCFPIPGSDDYQIYMLPSILGADSAECDEYLPPNTWIASFDPKLEHDPIPTVGQGQSQLYVVDPSFVNPSLVDQHVPSEADGMQTSQQEPPQTSSRETRTGSTFTFLTPIKVTSSYISFCFKQNAPPGYIPRDKDMDY